MGGHRPVPSLLLVVLFPEFMAPMVLHVAAAGCSMLQLIVSVIFLVTSISVLVVYMMLHVVGFSTSGRSMLRRSMFQLLVQYWQTCRRRRPCEISQPGLDLLAHQHNSFV